MVLTATVDKYLAGFLVFSVVSCGAIAQKADFTADKTGGCSPLDIRFTNTSTGFSAMVDYKWDFNGKH